MSTPNLGLEVLFSGHKLTVTQNATYIKGPNSQVRFVNAKTPLKSFKIFNTSNQIVKDSCCCSCCCRCFEDEAYQQHSGPLTVFLPLVLLLELRLCSELEYLHRSTASFLLPSFPQLSSLRTTGGF